MRLNICLIGAAMLLMADSASAEAIDCQNPQTQSDMTSCEAARHETADKALNVQYKKTRAALAAVDKDLDGDMKGAEQALVKAQRAWIDYRDAECDAFGFQARGGTMEPMLVAGCLANITDKRTKELKELEDTMSN
ncbi:MULTISPECIES: lysozyme inhibitor LprI family protein [unclassified Rhizobium]|uniref:lysozyme inhibitor LprI family protein n=1 Tax=unclassified Rhizobium TaxID=2613769 RepID=UPI0007EB096D|nr:MULTISPECIES: lysozyme inhibitor LprI family protein [unclassified Rhizobium]ANM11884.1 urease-associated protein [Rhizobium sp. N324]ANM18376.1 urease-associated protein [Rhizobium sp. N541]ANM24762.1 urease-associated protein [Rhizobium sp. N941]OYD05489.1 urease-associated protein [Rhizobium sp. N4311]